MARGLAVAVLLGLALALGPVLSTAGALPHGTAGASGAVEGASGVSAGVSWNGVPVGHASSASTAFNIGPGQSAVVTFNFTEAPGGARATNASLLLLYLGLTLSSESIATSINGSRGTAEMNWTFGSLIYLTEGVYEVDAQLLDAGGAVLFHQPFYIDARAPYVLGSLIAAMAVVLGIVEASWIRTVVRYRTARRRRRRTP